MLLKEIIAYLESVFPLSIQESYDNSGLLIGNPEEKIRKVLVCIDVTSEVIDEAITKKCNLIISHHPLIFFGIKKLVYTSDNENPVVKAIKNNIAVYAAHTNLDNGQNGINKILADKLKLINTKPLLPQKNLLRKLVTFCPIKSAESVRIAIFEAGAGHIGNYDCCSYNVEGFGTFRGNDDTNPYVGKTGELHHENEVRIETIYPVFIEKNVIKALLTSHPYEEVAYDIYNLNNTYNFVGSGIIGELEKEEVDIDFLKRVKKTLNVTYAKHTTLHGKKIKKIAICGGSGSFLIENALCQNADIFISADLTYHDYFVPSEKMILADFGHYETELLAKELLFSLLTKNFSTFAVLISEINTNPVHYL
jgi:dinuclear metal center YbgI/SA1388 family protein